MEDIIKKEYFIPKLTERLNQHIKSCVTCILADRNRGKQEGLLNPINKGDVPLESYHIDHLGPMTLTDKKNTSMYLQLWMDF